MSLLVVIESRDTPMKIMSTENKSYTINNCLQRSLHGKRFWTIRSYGPSAEREPPSIDLQGDNFKYQEQRLPDKKFMWAVGFTTRKPSDKYVDFGTFSSYTEKAAPNSTVVDFSRRTLWVNKYENTWLTRNTSEALQCLTEQLYK